MPTYTLKNISSDEERDIVCSLEELKEILLDDNIYHVFKPIGFVSGSKTVMRRAGTEWNQFLGNMKKNSGKGNTINL